MDTPARRASPAVSYSRPYWTPERLRGPEAPVGGTPELRPGQLRRTSTVDTLRPEGLDGPRVIRGVARDATRGQGGLRELATANVLCGADPENKLQWLEIEGERVLGLEGVTVAAGFRQRALARFPEARAAASPLWTLLDDLPTATMVSNYVRLAAGFEPPWVKAGKAPKADICSGWAQEATLVQESLRVGRQAVSPGPPAPSLGETGWHAMAHLPRHGGRRRRRLDVTPGEVLGVEAFFRDAAALGDAGEDAVIHEYGLRATVDPRSLEVLSVAVEAHVLPYMECPGALASAQRIVGMRLPDLRDRVRNELVGIGTCTHLNDVLRSLQDVTGLLAHEGEIHATAP